MKLVSSSCVLIWLLAATLVEPVKGQYCMCMEFNPNDNIDATDNTTLQQLNSQCTLDNGYLLTYGEEGAPVYTVACSNCSFSGVRGTQSTTELSCGLGGNGFACQRESDIPLCSTGEYWCDGVNNTCPTSGTVSTFTSSAFMAAPLALLPLLWAL